MADNSRAKLLLIVTGSSLRAEEMDRPLAYYLKQQVEQHLTSGGAAANGFLVRVVADFRWLNDKKWQRIPTVSVGGPGVNAVAHRWLEEMPVSLAVDEQYYIQMDPDFHMLRVSIWGMDNPMTQIAVSTFVHRYLPQFLEHCQKQRLGPIDPE
jgi:hypothetical protein